jgi:hypothetical protein
MPALMRLRQEDWEFETILDHITRPCLKKSNQNKQMKKDS